MPNLKTLTAMGKREAQASHILGEPALRHCRASCSTLQMKKNQSLESLIVVWSCSWLFYTCSLSSIGPVCSYYKPLSVLCLPSSDIGNARIAGLSEDLHLSSVQYEWLLRSFYITYILFKRMNLLWKVFPPNIYRTHVHFLRYCSMSRFDLELTLRTVSICVASWGLIASMQSMASSFISLLVLRAALGLGEAAFVGVPFFLSLFYRRDELAFRTGFVPFGANSFSPPSLFSCSNFQQGIKLQDTLQEQQRTLLHGPVL